MKSQWVIRISALAAVVAAGVVFARWEPPRDRGAPLEGDLRMGVERSDLDRARRLLQGGDYDGAVESALRAADNDPDRSFALRVLAESYRLRGKAGDDERMLEALRRVNEIETAASHRFRFANNFYRLGHVRLRIGEDESAREAFRRSAEIQRRVISAAERDDSLQASWHYDLACYEALAGDYNAALEAYECAVQFGFDNARQAMSDSDLAIIREDPRFIAATDRIVPRRRPGSWRASN